MILCNWPGKTSRWLKTAKPNFLKYLLVLIISISLQPQEPANLFGWTG
ncbi:MAG: hypothetical protein FD123_1101 [Bacteroidetes bacterium]|nr:MAG: hypothetical protein FD123_1101 [Bacteroidota bacterium]